MKDTILVPVRASEELPKELGCFYTYTPGRPLIKRFEPDRPEDWKGVEIWFKETTKTELLKEELEKRMPSDEIKLGMFLYHKDLYCGRERMKVVGIRENQIELEGDYSGGTHNVCQRDWESKEGILFKQSLQPKEKITTLKKAREITSTHNPVYGECAKHSGQSMINCPECAIEKPLPDYFQLPSRASCFHFDEHQGRNHCCCEEHNSVTCTGSDCGFFKEEG